VYLGIERVQLGAERRFAAAQLRHAGAELLELLVVLERHAFRFCWRSVAAGRTSLDTHAATLSRCHLQLECGSCALRRAVPTNGRVDALKIAGTLGA
jgi:hypothetical protein